MSGRSRPRSQRSPWPRRIGWLLVAVGSLVTVWVGAALVAGLASLGDLRAAEHDLLAAKSDLASIVSNASNLTTADGRTAATRRARAALSEAVRADSRLRHSAGLSVMRVLPVASGQRAAALELAGDATRGAAAAVQLVNDADAFAAYAQAHPGVLPLSALQTLSEQTRAAKSVVASMVRTGGPLIGPLAKARNQLNELAATTATHLRNAADDMQVTADFFGASGPRRYLVAAENNAEMRDQGAVLSYAVIDFADGKVMTEHTGPIHELALNQPVPLAVPAGMQEMFGDMEPTQLWQSVNATADFPFTGRAMAAMYQRAAGRSVDGVIAIDVPALASIMSVTGPVEVTGIPGQVDAGNVSSLLLDQLYRSLPAGSDTAQRRELESGVAAAVASQLQRGGYDAVALGRQLGEAAADGHLRLWSTVPSEEAILARQEIGGPPSTGDPAGSFHLALENATATKLDFFVQPKIEVRITLDPSGSAEVRTTVTAVNGAPADAQPSYQFGPQQYQSRAGQYIARVYYWTPAGSTGPGTVRESGLVLSEQNLEAMPGGSGSAVFTSTIPGLVHNGSIHLRFVPQPRAKPAVLTVTVDGAGWVVDGPSVDGRAWQQTIGLDWAAHRR